MSTIADESIGNIRVVKAFANEAEECRKFDKYSGEVYKLGMKKALWQGFFGFFTQLTLYGSMALIIYVANILYKRGDISIGLIASFLFYLLALLMNFWILNYVFANAMNVVGASDKIIKITNHRPHVNSKGGDTVAGKIEGQIELRNVKFHYPTKPDVQVLNGINLTIDNKKNRVVALCGTSGCGKSSIISMIERFYDPTDGEVLFNDVDIRDLNPRWYHENVSIVQQEPILFSGTIQENILYGLDWDHLGPDLIQRRIKKACDDANASIFLEDKDDFPDGYDTIVGERGVKLSGGQK